MNYDSVEILEAFCVFSQILKPQQSTKQL